MVDWDPTIDVAAEGVPGSGKTTWLLDKLREELQRETVLESVVVTTYRRPMANDLQQRAISDIEQITELPDEHYFRTTHSICFGLIDKRRREVINESQRREAIESVSGNLTFGGASPGIRDGDVESTSGIADTLFRYRGYCIQTLTDPVDGWRKARDALGGNPKIDRAGDQLVREFNEQYEAYKDEHGLLDFDDMLLEVWRKNLTPNATVLMEDEFQDKTPLQIAIHDQWSDKMKRTYVAGDIYQSLYGFQGTKPKFMGTALEEADETVILDKSYRFGPSLWNSATDVLKQAGYEVPEIEPAGETDIQRIPWDQYVARVADGVEEESLHLARTNRLTRQMAEELSALGIPFTTIGDRGSRWSEALQQKYNATIRVAEAVRENAQEFGYADYSDLSTGDLETVIPLLPASGANGVFRSNATKSDAVSQLAADPSGFEFTEYVDERAVLDLFDDSNPFRGLVTSKLGGDSAPERLKSAYRMLEGQEIGSIKHTVSTIHGAKGRQAPTVYLMDKSSKTAEEDSDPKEEARVWYVGITRAADRLFVVSPKSGGGGHVPY